MARFIFSVLLPLTFAACSAGNEAALGADTRVCSVGESRTCMCDAGSAGTQSCDSFTRSWSMCLCELGNQEDPDSVMHGDTASVVPSVPGASTPTVHVAGDFLMSPNYELSVVVPALPASEWLESESYRIRLGVAPFKEDP